MIKTIIILLIGITFLFGLFSFYFISVDIAQWSELARGNFTFAVFVFVVTVFISKYLKMWE